MYSGTDIPAEQLITPGAAGVIVEQPRFHIVVFGRAGAGKSSVASELSDALGACRVAETADVLIGALAEIYGIEPAFIYQNKAAYRRDLRALGDTICKHAPAALMAECAAKAEIIVGPRRRSEIEAWLRMRTPADAPAFFVEVERQDTRITDGYELDGISLGANKWILLNISTRTLLRETVAVLLKQINSSTAVNLFSESEAGDGLDSERD